MFKQRFLVVALLLTATALYAETPAEKGLAIAVEMDKRDTGWGDSRSEMLMTLRNAYGQESKRQIRSRNLEVKGDGDKSLTIFDQPRDVKGTAFLSFTHAKGQDDQWLYLPALKRVKRISSSNKSGPFMGSEFAFEDISSQEVEKYTYKYLRDEKLDGLDCFVVERKPTYEHSGYTRMVSWIDKEKYRAVKIEYYDRKDSLLKTLRLLDYKLYLGKYWRTHRMEMLNHQTKKSTVLEFNNFSFKTGLTDRDFDKNALKRLR
ncbi:MAG: outer membrane lipoprotein-sorting protein [Gammaproteobacteria bacterium]|nr:outer membrane lipoprotein-sorting protein [Gammaproteobacteria bacterium]MDH5653956.1 outer membrane lipoprotein-sorting protein [Gammaproteobacteria bacterium]